MGLLLALGVTCSSAVAETRTPAAPLADAAPEAKKAIELLEGAKGMLERATAKGDHREKALASVGQALAAIGGASPTTAPVRHGGSDLAADSKLVSALKLLVGAKAALDKAGPSYSGAKTHVDAAIGHVKAAVAAG